MSDKSSAMFKNKILESTIMVWILWILHCVASIYRPKPPKINKAFVFFAILYLKSIIARRKKGKG
jgi:hypothetical protein